MERTVECKLLRNLRSQNSSLKKELARMRKEINRLKNDKR